MNNNAIVHVLPPYSPDYTSIENMFSKLKTQMKAIETDLASSALDSDTMLLTDVDCTINV